MVTLMKIFKDVVPLTDLRQNSTRIVSRVRNRQRPILITRRGRSAAILEDVKQYERRLKRLELLEAVVRGLRASQTGDLLDNAGVMRRLRKAALGYEKIP